MRRTLIAALIAAAGLGGSAYGQAIISKVGVLSVSLANQYQGYQVGNTWGVVTNQGSGTRTSWDDHSYQFIWRCNGVTTYKSSSKKVDNKALITALNAAFTRPGGLFVTPGTAEDINPFYGGKFDVNNAKIVIVNYENGLQVPPYPPTMEGLWANQFNPIAQEYYYNAPWSYDPLGSFVGLQWPNQNYITWGKPLATEEGPEWRGAQVFVSDPNNKKLTLQCFDVTPFFAIDESLCRYCWDTVDRVTDGSITSGVPSATLPPCDNGQQFDCGRKGSGTTKMYLTLKFNNVQQPANPVPYAPNPLLNSQETEDAPANLYYTQIKKFSRNWAKFYGVILDPARKTASDSALNMTVSGVYTYKWSYKNGVSIGTYNSQVAGHGYSPMCGQFTGPVSIVEKFVTDSMFKGTLGCVTVANTRIVPPYEATTPGE